MKYVIGVILYVAVLMLGGWLFNIHPTFAELLLVTVATTIACLAEEW